MAEKWRSCVPDRADGWDNLKDFYPNPSFVYSSKVNTRYFAALNKIQNSSKIETISRPLTENKVFPAASIYYFDCATVEVKDKTKQEKKAISGLDCIMLITYFLEPPNPQEQKEEDESEKHLNGIIEKLDQIIISARAVQGKGPPEKKIKMN